MVSSTAQKRARCCSNITTHIPMWEVQTSNFGHNPGYPNWDFRDVPQSLAHTGIVPRIGHDRFLSCPSNFTTHQATMIYNPRWWQRRETNHKKPHHRIFSAVACHIINPPKSNADMSQSLWCVTSTVSPMTPRSLLALHSKKQDNTTYVRYISCMKPTILL
jgi:hypothetical protein